VFGKRLSTASGSSGVIGKLLRFYRKRASWTTGSRGEVLAGIYEYLNTARLPAATNGWKAR
jgi:hypothetical protein